MARNREKGKWAANQETANDVTTQMNIIVKLSTLQSSKTVTLTKEERILVLHFLDRCTSATSGCSKSGHSSLTRGGNWKHMRKRHLR